MSICSVSIDNSFCVEVEQADREAEKCMLQPKHEDDRTAATKPEHEARTFKQKVAFLFHSKAFNLIIVSMCALDGLLVICMLLLEIESLKTKDDMVRSRLILTQFIFECTSLSIIGIFLIEIPFKLWLFGWKFYFRNLLELIDAVVCIISFTVDVFNIIRHTRHPTSHPKTDTDLAHSKPEDQAESVQKTLADAAGLLVLFRLWRVIRIVNAIIISVTTSQDGTMRALRDTISKAEERVAQLESLLSEHQIPIPPNRRTEKLPMKPAEET